MSLVFSRTRWFAVALMAGSLTGCVVTVTPNDGGGGGGGGGGGTPEPTTVRVRVVNETDFGVEGQVYFSGAATNSDELFVRSNLYTGYGLFGRGLIDRQSSDEFEVDCEDARLLGTYAGRFVDSDGDTVGEGTQRVFTLDVGFNCGETITLIYRESGGDFETVFAVSN